ncbi:MAG: hypothetical protein HRU25_15225 [Psychrobium sp.]|nr:hypothetical protein [Psychrobium sp.]
MNQLAKITRLSKATMPPLLKRFEQKWLIERQKNILLTDAGTILSNQSTKSTEQDFPSVAYQ